MAQVVPDKPTFNRDIRPILSDHCFACHGPDSRTRVSELRLDHRDSLIENDVLDREALAASDLLVRLLSDDPELQMPPPGFAKPLDETQRQTLKRWIEQGAVYEEHWAYVPPVRPQTPSPQAIDYWIDRGLKQAQIDRGPIADREILVRRVFLDLIGLPPTPEQRAEFLNDRDPRAYEHLVDRLLAMPQYGERMALAWLDVVRYADTVGYHGDQNQNVFPYRDWVVDAYNRNLPFDQFTIAQLAGDQVESPSMESRIASCFNRLNMMTREGGAQPEEYLAKYAADRVRTVSGAWLGSTLGCAECHDHKYDPFTMRDFYSMAAFFADLRQWGVYQDYDYTPNPDLRGWSNDHPFPPELVVDVPYLQRRIEQLTSQRKTAIDDWFASTPGDQEPALRWLKTIQHFLQNHPSGWAPLVTETVDLTRSTGVRLANGVLEITAEKPEALTLSVRDPGFAIHSLSLQLLPEKPDDQRLFASGTASLQLFAEVVSSKKEGKKPVPFTFADATVKLPRYANTFEVLGIAGQWRVAADSQPTPRGTWVLEAPLLLGPEDELIIKISGNRSRRIRLDGSPLIPERLDEPEAWLPELQMLAREGPDLLASHPSFWGRQYLLSQAPGGALSASIRSIEMQIRECRNGQWPVQVSESQPPRLTRVLPRGNWQDQSGPEVEPAFPHFLPPQQSPSSTSPSRLRRLDLARWLVDPQNPLTARVQMNRLWKQFFGAGLSPVLDDFGLQGQFPSHPELLDWLAVEFRESGWNVKHMVKTLVMSEAYRRTSRPSEQALEKDPRNSLWSHQNPRRLEAELIRDNALAISGLLNLDLGGPPVFPYQPANYYEHLQFPDRRYVASRDDRQYRRGLYMHWQRTFLHPMLANFDAPSREECTALRTEANTPQQALTLLNDPSFVEAARELAARVIAQAADPGERIALMFHRALARAPTPAEQERLQSFLQQQLDHFSQSPEDARRLLSIGNAPPPNVDHPPVLAAWTQVARAILNLHETFTRY